MKNPKKETKNVLAGVNPESTPTPRPRINGRA
jgi:hypothetical protein